LCDRPKHVGDTFRRFVTIPVIPVHERPPPAHTSGTASGKIVGTLPVHGNRPPADHGAGSPRMDSLARAPVRRRLAAAEHERPRVTLEKFFTWHGAGHPRSAPTKHSIGSRESWKARYRSTK
jgi:hypothetical protein